MALDDASTLACRGGHVASKGKVTMTPFATRMVVRHRWGDGGVLDFFRATTARKGGLSRTEGAPGQLYTRPTQWQDAGRVRRRRTSHPCTDQSHGHTANWVPAHSINGKYGAGRALSAHMGLWEAHRGVDAPMPQMVQPIKASDDSRGV